MLLQIQPKMNILDACNDGEDGSEYNDGDCDIDDDDDECNNILIVTAARQRETISPVGVTYVYVNRNDKDENSSW